MNTFDPGLVSIDYTNWRGERRMRLILPLKMAFGRNTYHPGQQWLLQAKDMEIDALRTFAMQNIHSWTPAKDGGAAA